MGWEGAVGGGFVVEDVAVLGVREARGPVGGAAGVVGVAGVEGFCWLAPGSEGLAVGVEVCAAVFATEEGAFGVLGEVLPLTSSPKSR
jgi:hypothetical protein